MRSRTARVAAVLAALLLVAWLGAEGIGPAGAAGRPRPVSTKAFADPSVLAYRGGYVALGTGWEAPAGWAPTAEGPWQHTGSALARVPGWASDGGVWAPDAAKIGHRYVMYYSVPVSGLGPDGRCIGAATASSPQQAFEPAGDRPLVCPAAAWTRRAPDGVRTARSSLPRRGVIDPSVLRLGRRSYLLYKTQGTPATIRIVRLSRNGLSTRGRSHQLIETSRITENPVVTRHGRAFYLFTSEGSYASCSYATTWRRSRSLLSWRGAAEHTLLSSRSTGVCGPGGADVVQRPGRRSLVFFHGWRCGDHTCSSYGITHRPEAQRILYAGGLSWRAGTPRVITLRAMVHRAAHHRHKKPAHHHRKKHKKKAHPKRRHPKHPKKAHRHQHAAKKHRAKKAKHHAGKHHHAKKHRAHQKHQAKKKTRHRGKAKLHRKH